MKITSAIGHVLLSAAIITAAPTSNTKTSLTLLYQNNLNYTDDANHVSAILLDAMDYSDGCAACEALGEQLLPKSTLQSYKSDFVPQLSYAAFAKYVGSPDQAYWINGGVVVATEGAKNFKFPSTAQYTSQSLPVLCTNSQEQNEIGGYSAAPSTAQISVKSGDTFVGYRTKKSFFFNGIHYAEFPGRWSYTSVYAGNDSVVDAQLFGPQCIQYGYGSEDCFYLNIETPHIPKAGSHKDLRPVMFWIHGGGFTGGQGAGNGGQLASREDIVTVTINYRLGNYGFLAIPGVLEGNYGIGDQITALQWVIDNIAKFGGDPNKITIAGQSAGAGSVRVLLGSPLTIGKFAGAIAESNLGVDRSLGIGLGYGTTYSTYLTVNESYTIAGQGVIQEAGCTDSTDLAAQVACLRASTADFSSFGYVARYVVQDGTIVNTLNLEVATKNNHVAHVPVIFGVAENDGASLGSYSETCTTEVECLAYNIGISEYWAQQVIDSGLFPLYDTGNITSDSFNVSQRVQTDLVWRCVDAATMYAGSVSGAFPDAYYYESVRAYPEDAYNPFGVDITGTIMPEYPLGDPNTFYYKVHSSDIPAIFGSLHSYRDANDLYAIQLTSGYFSSFVKTGQPNPSRPYLQIRGQAYTNTLQAIKKTGPWNRVGSLTGPIKLLDYPAVTSTFVDVPQCAWLNITTGYYFVGGY